MSKNTIAFSQKISIESKVIFTFNSLQIQVMLRILRDLFSLIIAWAIILALFVFTGLGTRVSNLLGGTTPQQTSTADGWQLSSSSGSCVTPRWAVMGNNTAIVAYEHQTASSLSQCTKQLRSCVNGYLDGAFQYKSCIVSASTNVLPSWNGKIVVDNDYTTQCKTPWGTRISNGQYVVAYEGTRGYNGTCNSERRYCQNGVLQGTYSYNYCTLYRPSSHIAYYQNPSYSSTTTVYQPPISNPTKPGYVPSYPGTTISSANKSCLTPRGSTVSNWAYVVAYQTPVVDGSSTCQYQRRSCINGYLAGTFLYQSCQKQYTNGQRGINNSYNNTIVNNNINNSYNTNSNNNNNASNNNTNNNANNNGGGGVSYLACPNTARWNLQHGQSITAYASATVPYGSICQSQTRTCVNWQLNGTYGYTSCSMQSQGNGGGTTTNNGGSCSFEGDRAFLRNYGEARGYLSASDCSQKSRRRCYNGYLDGNTAYKYGSCTGTPTTTTTTTTTTQQNSPANSSCKLADGTNVANYASIRAYKSTTSCSDSVVRNCYNGYLDGNNAYGYATCH